MHATRGAAAAVDRAGAPASAGSASTPPEPPDAGAGGFFWDQDASVPNGGTSAAGGNGGNPADDEFAIREGSLCNCSAPGRQRPLPLALGVAIGALGRARRLERHSRRRRP